MPTLDTVTIYPGLCLVEATTLSEGRGTTRPFHLVGAPGVDALAIVGALRERPLPGVAFRAARFRPAFGKHANLVCDGIEIHVSSRSDVRPVALGLHVVQVFHDVAPSAFGWRSEPYEFIAGVPALDLLTGSPAARTTIDSGASLAPLVDSWRTTVDDFEASLDGILLYHDAG
jgi:uncharacterized protein YbbC (DUF1343 family)